MIIVTVAASRLFFTGPCTSQTIEFPVPVPHRGVRDRSSSQSRPVTRQCAVASVPTSHRGRSPWRDLRRHRRPRLRQPSWMVEAGALALANDQGRQATLVYAGGDRGGSFLLASYSDGGLRFDRAGSDHRRWSSAGWREPVASALRTGREPTDSWFIMVPDRAWSGW